jgi:hypothetical protein
MKETIIIELTEGDLELLKKVVYNGTTIEWVFPSETSDTEVTVHFIREE